MMSLHLLRTRRPLQDQHRHPYRCGSVIHHGHLESQFGHPTGIPCHTVHVRSSEKSTQKPQKPRAIRPEAQPGDHQTPWATAIHRTGEHSRDFTEGVQIEDVAGWECRDDGVNGPICKGQQLVRLAATRCICRDGSAPNMDTPRSTAISSNAPVPKPISKTRRPITWSSACRRQSSHRPRLTTQATIS